MSNAPLIEAIHQFVKLAALSYKRVFGPYKRRSGPDDQRMIVIVEYPDGRRKTKSYPKHLKEMELGRELDINDTVDHLNYSIDDNSPGNLVVRPRSEHSALDTRRVKLIDCECVECGKHFQRSPRLIRQRTGKQGPFCSKPCAARYTRKVQLGKAKRAPTQRHVPSEYYRRKLLQHAATMADKWGFVRQG